MFNGIIYKKGTVVKIEKNRYSHLVSIKTNLKFKKSELGTSLCCNGACLTITKIQKQIISFYLSIETLNKTNFRFLKIGENINLEKSISYGSKISGHYIQGHVDTTAIIKNITIKDKTWIIKFFIPKKYNKYLIEKGSIGINGVSLTISKVFSNMFEINIIPHTLKLTNLINLKKKDLVNVEIDIFSKYLLKLKN